MVWIPISFEDEAAKQVRIGAYLNRYANMNPIIDMITELNLVNIKQRRASCTFPTNSNNT